MATKIEKMESARRSILTLDAEYSKLGLRCWVFFPMVDWREIGR